jgi:hypothetical protein
MSHLSNHFNVQLLYEHASTRTTPTPEPGDATVNIQASENWVVIGQYRDSRLQSVRLEKLPPRESESATHGRD